MKVVFTCIGSCNTGHVVDVKSFFDQETQYNSLS